MPGVFGGRIVLDIPGISVGRIVLDIPGVSEGRIVLDIPGVSEGRIVLDMPGVSEGRIVLDFFFCGRSPVLRPSVHMLSGTGWCGAGLLPFPTACWWLAHPAAITGVSVSARWDSSGGCGGPSVLLLCNRRVQSP